MAISSKILRGISLCAGGGGLDLGVELAFESIGIQCKCECFCEWEGYAAATLVARMADQALVQAPVWDNLRTFDGRPGRGKIHGVLAGYPCQPFSCAGRRAGAADERHLWPEVLRVVEEIEPAFVFLENVAGHLSLGFDVVKTDLERIGYRVAAGLFTAAEVGASHRRERLFILGFKMGHTGLPPGNAEHGQQSHGASGGVGQSGERIDEPMADSEGKRNGAIPARPRNERQGEAESDGRGEGLANPLRQRRQQITGGSSCDESEDEGRSSHGNNEPECAGEAMDNANGEQIDGRRIAGVYEAVGEPSGELGDTAKQGHNKPGHEGLGELSAEARVGVHDRPQQPSRELGGNGVDLADSNEPRSQGFSDDGLTEPDDGQLGRSSGTEIPTFPPGPGEREQWAAILAGRPDLAPAVESPVRGVVDGLAEPLGYRNDELRLLGNGVVPLEAAYAFLSLLAHFEE